MNWNTNKINLKQLIPFHTTTQKKSQKKKSVVFSRCWFQIKDCQELTKPIRIFSARICLFFAICFPSRWPNLMPKVSNVEPIFGVLTSPWWWGMGLPWLSHAIASFTWHLWANLEKSGLESKGYGYRDPFWAYGDPIGSILGSYRKIWKFTKIRLGV